MATSAKQDTMITDLGSIVTAVQGNLSVTETNPIDVSALATSAKQDTIITGLDAIYTATGDTAINTTPIAYSPVHLDLETQGSITWADSTEDWTAPLNGENGWLYENKVLGGANLYYYGNTGLVPGGVEPDFTLGSLMNMSFVGNYRLLLDTNPNKKFYLYINTKPQGAGDYSPGIFRSIKVYQLPSSAVISKGADYLFYAGTDITSFRRDLDHKEMTLAYALGPLGVDEVVQFMSINVDSGTPVNQFSGIVKEAYFSTAGGTNRQVVFDKSIARKAELNLSKLSVEMGTLQVNMAGFSFNGDSELLVTKQTYIDIRSGGIDLTHTTNGAKESLDVNIDNQITDYATETTLALIKDVITDMVPTNLFGQLSTGPTVLAPVAVDITGQLFVTDSQSLSQLEGVNTRLDAVIDGTSQFWVHTNAADDSMEMHGYNTTGNAPEYLESINHALKVAVADTVAVTGTFWPETQPISGSVGFIENSVVGIAGDSVIGITGSVQAHTFGSTNGTDWHHILTSATGEVVTHSQTRDGAGNQITSTAEAGTETYRALDVKCRGTTTVGGSVTASAGQYGSYGNLANNIATILPAGVTGGINVSAWSYFIGAYEDYYSGMPGTGSLRLEYSFDNTTYYTLFNTTISPGGTGTPRTANIQKQDIPAINWIRFKNDSSVTLASVTITLLGGSLS